MNGLDEPSNQTSDVERELNPEQLRKRHVTVSTFLDCIERSPETKVGEKQADELHQEGWPPREKGGLSGYGGNHDWCSVEVVAERTF